MLKGIGASKGYGIGKAYILKSGNISASDKKFSGAENEKRRLSDAVKAFTDETKALAEHLRLTAGDSEAQILEGHIAMLNDPFMLAQMNENIENGSNAEAAVGAVCDMFISMFSSVEDEQTRQRASDVCDIKDSLLGILLGVKSPDLSVLPKGTVIVANDLTPSLTSKINKDNISAIITETGGTTSHSAILARAMGIPAVLSVENAVNEIPDRCTLAVDGFDGTVIIDPTDMQICEYKSKQTDLTEKNKELSGYFDKCAVTKSGSVKRVYANIGSPEEAQNALSCGAEGIGLFRTEFLFMDRTALPTEEEQYNAYSAVAKLMNGKEVIIRTLDIGGDKQIDYLNIAHEENPFLGHRAIRYCLDNKDTFKTQIKAILRAAVHGDVKIMLPLVTTPDEVKAVKALIEQCKTELSEISAKFGNAPLGVMIETPAAALISDILAKEVSFFSIGTNDLTGYVMAVDRGNAAVSGLYDTSQPAVLKAIEMTVKNAKAANIPVGMCGEAAADPKLIPLFAEWGLDEFSVAPSSVLATKKHICECE